ncbi:MAG: PD-(D/E)XK nuclease family protein [Candidatus Methanoperedens sp.]
MRVDTKFGRYYEYDGVRYPSVTTVLSKIAKPWLTKWQVDTPIDYIQSNVSDTEPSRIHTALPKIIEDSRQVTIKKSDFAKDRGTEIHRLLEHFFKNKKYNPDRKYVDEEFEQKLLANWSQWRERYQFELIEAELEVYNQRYKYAGTVDLFGTVIVQEDIEPEIIVVDFKTGGTVGEESQLQLAAYSYAIMEMNPEYSIDRAFVFHILPTASLREKRILFRLDLNWHYEHFVYLRKFFRWGSKGYAYKSNR